MIVLFDLLLSLSINWWYSCLNHFLQRKDASPIIFSFSNYNLNILPSYIYSHSLYRYRSNSSIISQKLINDELLPVNGFSLCALSHSLSLTHKHTRSSPDFCVRSPFLSCPERKKKEV